MIKANNIANALTNSPIAIGIGRLSAPLLGRGWGRLGLLLLLLLVGTRYAHAQNNSMNPYINSVQKYRVPMGNSGNTVQWDLLDNTTTPTSTKDLTTLDNGGATWITVGTEVDAGTTYAWITIKYITAAPASFVAGQTWYLVYSEMNGSACEARRATDVITLNTNDFTLACSADAADCNSWSGDVFPNSLDINANQTSAITFNVAMTKNANHRIRQWIFEASINVVGTNYSIDNPLFATTNGNTVGGHGTWSISNVSGNSFRITVTVTDHMENYTADEVEFSPSLLGPATQGVAATITITSAWALSGASSQIVTDENGFAAGDENQTITINPIPATSVISMAD